MTATKSVYSNPALVNSYKELFSEGLLSLDELSSNLHDQIKDLSKRIQNADTKIKSPETELSNLLRRREVFVFSIDAKKDYYDSTSSGRIASVYQNFLELLGFTTTLKKAQEVLNDFNTIISDLGNGNISVEDTPDSDEPDFDDEFFDDLADDLEIQPESIASGGESLAFLEGTNLAEDEGQLSDAQRIRNYFKDIPNVETLKFQASLDAQTIMTEEYARIRGITAPKTHLETVLTNMRKHAVSQQCIIHIPPGTSSANPSQMLVAKPNGDVLVIDINKYKKGEGRYIFINAIRYSIGKEPKEIAIMSSFPCIKPPSTLDEYIEALQPVIQQVNESIKHEVDQVQKLRGMKGVINTQNPFSINFEGTEFLFAEMNYFPLGSLNSFLRTETGKNLTNEQKEHLINSIVNIVRNVHNAGTIHRDIKSDNILVTYNEETNFYEAVLIDWETSRAIKEDKREFASTLQFWPPEYINAYVANGGDLEKGRESLNDVPAVSLDYWNLGLVIYQIWNGEDYTTDILKYVKQGNDKLTQAETLQICQGNISPLPSLTPTDRMIRGLLDPDPMKRLIVQE